MYVLIKNMIDTIVENPLLRYTALIIAVIFGVWLYGNHRYNQGASDKDAEYQTIIAEERHRIIEANQTAIIEANERIRDLETNLESRNELLSDIQRRIDEDPDSLRNALDADWVRELNQID